METPHPNRHRLARDAARRARKTTGLRPSHLTPPTTLDDPITPTSLPEGWVVLNPATDMLPRFPDYNGTTVKGCTGAIPIYLDGTTIKAITLSSGGDLAVADTTAWTSDDWNTQGTAWMVGDSHNKYMTLNWDVSEYEAARGYGGIVYSSYSNVITGISGGTIASASGHDDGTVPKQFTILMHLDMSGAAADVVTLLDYNDDDRRLLIWGGWVRKLSDGTSEVRHMNEYDDPLRVENVYDAQDCAMVPGEWYTLSYQDEDVVAKLARPGEHMTYQAVLRYFTPLGALAISEDVGGYLAAEADVATVRPDMDLPLILLGIVMVVGVIIMMVRQGSVWIRDPTLYLIMAVGIALAWWGFRPSLYSI